MAMKMLEAGGIPALTDHIRTADTDNPKGYYEFERVKKLKDGDTAWLPEAREKRSRLSQPCSRIYHLSMNTGSCSCAEKLKRSWHPRPRCLENRGEESKVDDETMAALFRKHMRQVRAWMNSQPNLALSGPGLQRHGSRPRAFRPANQPVLGG